MDESTLLTFYLYRGKHETQWLMHMCTDHHPQYITLTTNHHASSSSRCHARILSSCCVQGCSSCPTWSNIGGNYHWSIRQYAGTPVSVSRVPLWCATSTHFGYIALSTRIGNVRLCNRGIYITCIDYCQVFMHYFYRSGILLSLRVLYLALVPVYFMS